MIAALAAVVLSAAPVDAPTQWVVEGVHIAAPKLVVRRKTDTKPPKKPGQPTWASDQFQVMTDYGPFKLQYTRYLNRAPQFTGRHAACTNSDSGLGIEGLGSNWYRGNTIRVLLEGRDIVGAYAADAVDVREGFGVTRLRFAWKLPKADVAIHVAVVNRRAEAFVEVTVHPHATLKSVGVNLLCYPGGYGPAYGIPSRRVARTAQTQVSVATGQKSRTFTLGPGCPWVWYADHECQDRGLHSGGSVALVLLPKDRAAGEVHVSNYGVSTRLRYPGTQSRVRLGLTAYPGPNPRAWGEFVRHRPGVVHILQTLAFWPGACATSRP